MLPPLKVTVPWAESHPPPFTVPELTVIGPAQPETVFDGATPKAPPLRVTLSVDRTLLELRRTREPLAGMVTATLLPVMLSWTGFRRATSTFRVKPFSATVTTSPADWPG